MFLRITANGLSREDNQERVDQTKVREQYPDPAPIQVPGPLFIEIQDSPSRFRATLKPALKVHIW